MKKILLLGGSSQQVIAIETAKKLGLYTVLCDYLPDNPGQYSADKFYLVSTTDKDAVLKVAEDEKVDGVAAYASDPAAPTAAYVCEKMGLHTNPCKSVETLCNKDMFRKFLSDNGFNVPKAESFSDAESAVSALNSFDLPVIIKPVDSSGSKGITVLKNQEDGKKAVEFAFSFSRCKRIVIETFIEKDHPFLIGGDIFIWDGKVIMWGLLNCYRDANVNPLVPVGKSYPPIISDIYLNSIKKVLQDLVTGLGIQYGAMNVELVTDKSGKVYPIDIGPRNGGNMIPDLLGYIFDADVVEMTVKAAMGEIPALTVHEGKPFYATHNIHSDKNGIYDHVYYSPEIEPFIIKKCEYKKPGDPVEYFDNAAKALGIVFFKFDNEDSMKKYLENINDYIRPVLK